MSPRCGCLPDRGLSHRAASPLRLNNGTNPVLLEQQVRTEVTASADVLHAIPGVLKCLCESKLKLLARHDVNVVHAGSA